MGTSRLSLPVIVFAQFCCTSLWFAGNGVMNDLIQTFDLGPAALGHLTSAVQFGFITGTLGFAFLGIADRFSPSKVFFYSAIFGSLFNLGILVESNSSGSLLMLRFLTGFSLAGIYPVGMKIASDYYREGLGKSLGFLVGALVLGTALPHLLLTVTGLQGLPEKRSHYYFVPRFSWRKPHFPACAGWPLPEPNVTKGFFSRAQGF